MTILLSSATWCNHSLINTVSGSPITGTTGRFSPMVIAEREEPQNPGTQVTFDPLEGKLLYFAGNVTSNTDVGTFELQLRKNDGTTPIAKLEWVNEELGRKTLLLNIPMLVGDYFKGQVIKPTNNSIVDFHYMIAGKL